MFRATDRVFQGLLRFYGWSLRGVLRHRAAMGVLFVGVLGATGYLYHKVPKGFIPDADNDQMMLNIQAAQGTSYYKMVEYQKRIADIVRQDPDVETFMTNAGNGNNARFFVMLKAYPRAQLHRPAGGRAVAAENLPASRGSTCSPTCRRPSASAEAAYNSRSNYDFTLQGPGHRGTLRASRRPRKGDSQGSRSAGRQYRPGISQPAHQCRDRPRARGPVRAQPQRDPECPVRSLWSELRLHDLHAQIPVPRGDGSAEEVSGLSPIICPRSISRPIPESWFRWIRWRASRRTWGRRASRTPASFPPSRVSFNLKPGVSLGDVTEQAPDPGQADPARDHLGAASRGMPRRSRILSPTWACCSWWPCWWSTSFWACCMKATSIR